MESVGPVHNYVQSLKKLVNCNANFNDNHSTLNGMEWGKKKPTWRLAMLLKAVKRHMKAKLMMMTFFQILICSLRISLADMEATGCIPSSLLLQSAGGAQSFKFELPGCHFPVSTSEFNVQQRSFHHNRSKSFLFQVFSARLNDPLYCSNYNSFLSQ